MMEKPNVSIIVVNYNGEELLKPCLQSLLNLNYPKTKLEIIVVDNGSTDNSISMIKENFPEIKVLNNSENNYCKANNLGIRNSKGEYIAFVNNDVRVDENWLNELIKVLINKDTIAGVIGKILFRKDLIQSTGHYELPNFYWGDRGFREEDKGQFNKMEELKTIPDTASLYKKEVFNKVGPFDEDFQMYLEDVDIGLRCQKCDLKFLYVPAAICYHKFHGTAREDFLRFKIEKNRLLLVAKHFPDKLQSALSGQGYFQANIYKNNEIDIFHILPDILKKLLRHHPINKINELLPDIFMELSKFVNNDRYYLVQRLRDVEGNFKAIISKKEEEIRQKQEAINFIINQKEIEIAQKQELIECHREELKQSVDTINFKDREIAHLGEVIRKKEEDIRQKQGLIKSQEEDIRQKQGAINFKDKELVRLDKIIHEKEEKLQYFYNWMDKFYKSETYRFLLRPLWFTLDILKRIFRIGRFGCRKIVVIKPTIVSIPDTIRILQKLKSENPVSRITLVAFSKKVADKKELNLLNADRKIIFLDRRKLFNIFQYLKLFIFLVLKGSNLTYILIDPVLDRSYRKFKLLALLTRTKSIRLYMSNNNCQLSYPSLTKSTFLLMMRSISLYFLLLFFLIFIIGRIKLPQIFRRLILPHKYTK